MRSNESKDEPVIKLVEKNRMLVIRGGIVSNTLRFRGERVGARALSVRLRY